MRRHHRLLRHRHPQHLQQPPAAPEPHRHRALRLLRPQPHLRLRLRLRQQRQRARHYQQPRHHPQPELHLRCPEPHLPSVFVRSQLGETFTIGVLYYFADHLGSSRVVTSATSTVIDSCDYYPFGGEVASCSGSGNHYKFTGKERDGESGLDNFGKRYFGSSRARFQTADPVIVSPEKDDESSTMEWILLRWKQPFKLY